MINNKKEPIRVLCVFSSLDRGGAESMCMNLYRNIDRELVQFDFVKHTNKTGAFEEEILSMGGKIFCAPKFKGYNLNQYQDWWKKHLEAHPEHMIIHGHYFTASKYYFKVCKNKGRITVGHSHTDSYSNIIKKIMIYGGENYCDYRFACSKKAGELLYPHKDFVIINNAIDINKFVFNKDVRKQVRKEYGYKDNSLVIGTVGTIKDVKNPMGIVEIFYATHQKNKNVRLLWVGRDGGMQRKAQERIDAYGLTDCAVFVGSRPDVYRLLQGMDAFVLPSISEGLPVSVMEAQAAGLPCYISDTVTKDVDITGLCHFISNDKTSEWATAILEEKGIRFDTSSLIRKAGYDINMTTKSIQEFYLNCNGDINRLKG